MNWVKQRVIEQGGLCYWCKQRLYHANQYEELAFPDDSVEGGLATADHLTPLGLGGADTFENVVAACAECNQARGCSIGPPPNIGTSQRKQRTKGI